MGAGDGGCTVAGVSGVDAVGVLSVLLDLSFGHTEVVGTVAGDVFGTGGRGHSNVGGGLSLEP